jgi:hypothetical protein
MKKVRVTLNRTDINGRSCHARRVPTGDVRNERGRQLRWPLRRVKPAALPARYRFHRVFDELLMDVIELRAFEGPHIGHGRTRFDAASIMRPL